uniref:Uncharacterized protein n=1 Tax=Melanopsichium pennsylvanicum 4 TaxID=1398559 RepID=A0A077R935_9BASI|nr:uncharacterized protein BN887_06215 [Melanopsichium pennsylvanicum 4]
MDALQSLPRMPRFNTGSSWEPDMPRVHQGRTFSSYSIASVGDLVQKVVDGDKLLLG